MLKVKKIRPIFTKLITTANRYENDGTIGDTKLYDTSKLKGNYKEYQEVVAVGNAVREVKVGDVVLIDPTRYVSRKFDDNSLREDFVDNPIVNVNIPVVEMDGKNYFMINENDVAYVIEDYEEVPELDVSIIMPKKQTIIT